MTVRTLRTVGGPGNSELREPPTRYRLIPQSGTDPFRLTSGPRIKSAVDIISEAMERPWFAEAESLSIVRPAHSPAYELTEPSRGDSW